MEDNIPADGNGRTVIRMAEAEKQQDGSRTYGKDENKKDEKRGKKVLTKACGGGIIAKLSDERDKRAKPR